MNEHFRSIPLRTLVLICDSKMAERAGRLFAQGRLPIHYRLRAQGTVSGETMDMLGLGSVSKTLFISFLPKPRAAQMLGILTRELELGRANTGVAFTTTITGISNPAMKLFDEAKRREIRETMENDGRQMIQESDSSMVVAIVNQGYSEEVMDAARAAGARGGTVLHARQAGAEEAMNFWGITVQEEKEMVLIVAGAADKLAIMKAIGQKCGMHSEARGIVFSTPIDMIAGLDGGA